MEVTAWEKASKEFSMRLNSHGCKRSENVPFKSLSAKNTFIMEATLKETESPCFIKVAATLSNKEWSCST